MKPVVVNINLLEGSSDQLSDVLEQVQVLTSGTERAQQSVVPDELREFSSLSGEELHFLRVFIHCEGKIKEVEKALGVSYPTVKARLGQLKSKMSSSTSREPKASPSSDVPVTSIKVLEMLQQGLISHQQAVQLLKQQGET